MQTWLWPIYWSLERPLQPLLFAEISLVKTNTTATQNFLSSRFTSVLPMAFMSIQGASTSQSSLPSSPIWWKYHVFFSFRGTDTRHSFTDHLCTTLKQKGFFIFRDDERLARGKPIAPELFKAIKESMFAVVILSREYASSTWCLKELAKIVKCKKKKRLIILPVFYHVKPSDVRKQRGSFKQAFAKYEADNIHEVETWRAAFTEVANISGWDIDKRTSETKVIQSIVDHISQRWNSKYPSINKDMVGLESPMEKLITSYLELKNTSYLELKNGVCMTGIWGTGGLGKTVLAREIYEAVRHHFEGFSFIANVRGDANKHGLPRLQQQLLADILGDRSIDIRNIYDGVEMIKNRLCCRKVILVIDDVNQLDQLEKLAGERCWFGPGSWIIITTRDQNLLAQHGVDKIHKLNTLDVNDSQKLFCLKAFKTEQPKECYMKLIQDVVCHSDGLPFALVTWGCLLFGKTMNEWQSAVEKYKETYGRDVFEILKISYDELEYNCKEIFLDIACFFRGKKIDRVIEILENCGFEARMGIRVLIDKSLLTVANQTLWMCNPLQEMGREIVRQESRKEPGQRSRLWLHQDFFQVLMNNTETKVQAIVLDSFEEDEAHGNLEACPKAFSKMRNLRLLIINNVHIQSGLKYLPNNLRFLEWLGYPSTSLPSSFQSKELVELKLCFSKIEYLWRGVKFLNKLKLIDLEHSVNLIMTPNFQMVPRLERLCLKGCIKLRQIHKSIGLLSRLTILNLELCRSLIDLPSSMDGLKSLEMLILFGCSKLAKLPESLGEIECLKELDLTGTAIQEVPSSISFLICRGCDKKIFKSRLDSFFCVRTLKYIALSISNLVFAIPASISQLLKLEALYLGNCIQLQSLPDLPLNVRYINAIGCSSLEPSPALLSMTNLLQPSISFFNCCKFIDYNVGGDGLAFAMLKRYLQGLIYSKGLYEISTRRKIRSRAAFQIIIPGLDVPKWLSKFRFGNSICIELPLNWSHRWMGFALCALFRINCYGYLSERYSLKGHVTALGDMPHQVFGEIAFDVVIGDTSFDYIVDHIWLSCWSRDDLLGTHWNDYKCNRIFVRFNSSSRSVEIIKCAIRLIYEQDVDEFNQTIAQCNSSCVITSVGSDCVHEIKNLAVVKATEIMRTYDDNNETQCSASWSHPEEIERAMGKTKDELKASKTEQFRWSKPMQCLLPEKLANETIKGNKPSITFMPGSFTRAATEIHENFEAHPDSDQYLNKKIEMSDVMDLVLGKDKATWNSAKSVTDTDSEKRIVDFLSCDIDIIDSEKASKGKQVSFSNVALSQARSNRKRSQAYVNQYEKKLEKIELEIKKLKKDEPDAEELYEEVMKTHGFEEVMLGDAFDYLLNNGRVAQGFMVKNAKLRKSWLERFFKENGG